MALSAVIYFYIYQDHRNIATEKAQFTMRVSEIQSEFETDEKLATEKYSNQTIEIYGKITQVDLPNKSLILENVIFVQFDTMMRQPNVNENISVKGRLVGYDELMGEIIIDQAIEIKNEN